MGLFWGFRTDAGETRVHRDVIDTRWGITAEDIGKERGHPGEFLVRFRFPTPEIARAKLEAAIQAIETTERGLGMVTVYVPVVRRRHALEDRPHEISWWGFRHVIDLVQAIRHPEELHIEC